MYILNTQTGEIRHSDELMHYGVPGMKWGQRRFMKYQNKANLARASAKEMETKANKTMFKGKAERLRQKASAQKEQARIYDLKSKGMYSKRSEKLSSKSKIAKESAKEWDSMAKEAERKGKLKKATKFKQYAEKDRYDAERYSRKSKAIIDRKVKFKNTVNSIPSKTKSIGKATAEKLRKLNKK